MSNPNNTVSINGRLAGDPRVFTNGDGSHKVVMTVFADNNFKSRNGDWGSQALPVETFINAGTDVSRTPFGMAHKGDLVSLGAHLELQTYQRDGETVRDLKIVVDDIWFLESKNARDSRMAERVARAEAENAAAKAAQQTQPVEQTQQVATVDEELPFG